MRVGVLTFHETYNPGAYLQALGTVSLLRRMGVDGCVIDYTSPPHRFNPFKKLLRRPWSLVRDHADWLDSFAKDAVFRRHHGYLSKTETYLSHEELERERFDAVVIGADIVWDFTTKRIGRDPVYFGHHLHTDKLVAFAPSCGPAETEGELPDFVVSGLERFHRISVRDEKTQRLVARVTGGEPPILLDPAFQLRESDIDLRYDYSELGDFVLVYATPELISREYVESIVRFARARGMQTVAACYRHEWADRNLPYANPFQWLSLMQRARFVATNTFHGTAFSIIKNKAFCVEYNWSVRSKTEPMLHSLLLEDRAFDDEGTLERVMSGGGFPAESNERMEKRASEAARFLEEAIL